jgi:hypothetical protein
MLPASGLALFANDMIKASGKLLVASSCERAASADRAEDAIHCLRKFEHWICFRTAGLQPSETIASHGT